MTPTRLRLKHPSGWFAAGEEVRLALGVLSAEAFRLYIYFCLHAERRTGRVAWEPAEVVQGLHWDPEQLRAAMAELCRQQVCRAASVAAVEIHDRFWPYEKVGGAESAADLDSYVERARQMLLRPACVRASFSAADQRLAARWYNRGIPLTQLQRAIWLGCARKYVALLNGQTPMLITSLHYFAGLIDEVVETKVADTYWQHVQRKLEQLEKSWIAYRSSTAPGNETK